MNNTFVYINQLDYKLNITSQTLSGIQYLIKVHVPPDYHSNSIEYPAIYTTDGQWYFDSFSNALNEAESKRILVAICHNDENRRTIDFLPPGDKKYSEFIQKELIPLVERNFRIKTDDRSLVGTSYGGVFVISSLLESNNKAPLFENYMAFDASLYINEYLDGKIESRFKINNSLNAKLFLSGAWPLGNNKRVERFYKKLKGMGFVDVNMVKKTYIVSHSKVAQPSFKDAIEFIEKVKN